MASGISGEELRLRSCRSFTCGAVRRCGALYVLAAGVLFAAAWARAEAPRLVIPVNAGAPRVDGDLDEAFWAGAALTGRFADAASGEEAEPAVMARVASGPEAIYVAFVCERAAEGERLAVELAPDAAFAPAGGEAGEGAAEAARDAPRVVRVVVTLRGEVSVEGAGLKATAGVRLLPGGAAVEVRIPFEGLVAADRTPRGGDLWAAELKRMSGDRTAVWARSGGEALPRGDWVFVAQNLLGDGGFEKWDKGRPVGWEITVPGPEKPRPAPVARETDLAVEGEAACRVLYREKAEVRPAAKPVLRNGACYALSLVICLQPDPATQARATLSAAPHKTRDFDAPIEITRAAMPFRAQADHVEPAFVISGKSGAVIIDDFRLEMTRP